MDMLFAELLIEDVWARSLRPVPDRSVLTGAGTPGVQPYAGTALRTVPSW